MTETEQKLEQKLTQITHTVIEITEELKTLRAQATQTITEQKQRIDTLEQQLQESVETLQAIPDLDQIKSQEELDAWREALEQEDLELQQERQRLDQIKESKDLKRVRQRLRKRGEALDTAKEEIRTLKDAIVEYHNQLVAVTGENASLRKTLGKEIDGQRVNTQMISGILSVRELVSRLVDRGIVLSEEEAALFDRSTEALRSIFPSDDEQTEAVTGPDHPVPEHEQETHPTP